MSIVLLVPFYARGSSVKEYRVLEGKLKTPWACSQDYDIPRAVQNLSGVDSKYYRGVKDIPILHSRNRAPTAPHPHFPKKPVHTPPLGRNSNFCMQLLPSIDIWKGGHFVPRLLSSHNSLFHSYMSVHSPCQTKPKLPFHVTSKLIETQVSSQESTKQTRENQLERSVGMSPTSQPAYKNKQVRFSNVLIRLHDVTCTGFVNHGPGIGLGWFFTDGEALSLEEYEKSRSAIRPERELIMGPDQRKKVLMKGHGYELKDLHRICNTRVVARRSLSPQREGASISPKRRGASLSPKRRGTSTSCSPSLSL